MSDLKTVLVNALTNAVEDDRDLYNLDGPNFDDHADRLALAVRDHFLDREKVRGLIAGALIDQARANKDYWMMGPNVVRVETDLNVDDITDRLIAGLAGGSE